MQVQQAELLSLQRSIIEQQRQQQAVLLPFLSEQEGFDVTTDTNGTITSIKKRPDPDEAKRKELESGLLDRSLKALRGELPVDPALEETLRVQERQTRDKLSAQLGPGYETSSAGIETLGNFFRSAEILREGARTGQLTLAEQLGITREQQDAFSRQSSQDVLRQSAIGDPLTFAGAFGQTARGFGQAQQPFIQQRQMQVQAGIANAQSRASIFGAGIGAVGSLFGAFSDARLKTNIQPIGSDLLPGVPICLFEFIWEPGVQHLGVLAQDLQRVMPQAVHENQEGFLSIDLIIYEKVLEMARMNPAMMLPN